MGKAWEAGVKSVLLLITCCDGGWNGRGRPLGETVPYLREAVRQPAAGWAKRETPEEDQHVRSRGREIQAKWADIVFVQHPHSNAAIMCIPPTIVMAGRGWRGELHDGLRACHPV